MFDLAAAPCAAIFDGLRQNTNTEAKSTDFLEPGQGQKHLRRTGRDDELIRLHFE
ncbi:MAG: hypothetical protein FWC43_05825 [Planctomycetaceae bacterium]|nr:hypothetical protein [Planctomycetaceae bacterium]